MAAPQRVIQAVQAAILASAHLAAYESVAAAAQACQRLGSLSSGRWRSAGRDLVNLEDDLETAFRTAAETLTARADEVGVSEDALWTVGDAAGTLELLRDSALDELEDSGGRAAKVLQSAVLFGVSFVEDPELPDRGTTLLFGWPEPLAPASWPWQANWVVGNGQDTSGDGNGSKADDLDLFESGEMEGVESVLAELADELGCSRQDARMAFRQAAIALTRASLLAGAGEAEEEDEEDGDEGDDQGS